MLLVGGELTPRSEHGRHRRRGRLVGEACRDFVAASEQRERRRGHAPWLARRAVAAGQCQRPQPAGARERPAVDQQQLAAPRGSIGAQAHAIQRQPQHRRLDAMLGQHCRHVRMVVLDRTQRHARRPAKFTGEARAVELRMQVVRDDGRSHVDDRHQVGGRAFQRHAGGRIVEVADVLRDEGLVVAGDADRVLEIAAQRQYRRSGARQPDRPRRVSASAAHELEPRPRRIRIVERAHDAVVAADDDVAVVDEEGIGDARQAYAALRRCR